MQNLTAQVALLTPRAHGSANQRPVRLDLPHHGFDFGISSLNNASELSDHADALCKLAVEGCSPIRESAAGSGPGFGHCTISGTSALCVVAQPLSASSASDSSVALAGKFFKQFIGVLL